MESEQIQHLIGIMNWWAGLQGTLYEQLGGSNTSATWRTQEPSKLGSVPQQPHWLNPSITLQALQSQIPVRIHTSISGFGP